MIVASIVSLNEAGEVLRPILQSRNQRPERLSLLPQGHPGGERSSPAQPNRPLPRRQGLSLRWKTEHKGYNDFVRYLNEAGLWARGEAVSVLSPPITLQALSLAVPSSMPSPCDLRIGSPALLRGDTPCPHAVPAALGPPRPGMPVPS